MSIMIVQNRQVWCKRKRIEVRHYSIHRRYVTLAYLIAIDLT